MRKYKASVAAVSTDQITIQDQQASIQELELSLWAFAEWARSPAKSGS